MDERTWEQKLADILTKEPAALTPGDIEFIRARRSYLDEKQLETFADLLDPEGKVEKSEKKTAKKAE